MLVLVIDTATPAVTTAVVLIDRGATGRTGVRLLAQRSEVDARAHAELLGPAIRVALAEAGAGVGDVAAIVAGVGPGPFTGLRVGLATAAAMGQALSIPTYAVCSLDAIGASLSAAHSSGHPDTGPTALVATDARRKEIYWGLYRGGFALTAPAVDRPAHVVELLAERNVAVAVGDGARMYASVLPYPVLDEARYPSPAALARLAADRVRSGTPGEGLAPLYLRRPDAAQPHAPKPVTA